VTKDEVLSISFRLFQLSDRPHSLNAAGTEEELARSDTCPLTVATAEVSSWWSHKDQQKEQEANGTQDLLLEYHTREF
jgi:hypothetical protein